jgi:hypothetical protein
MKWSKHTSYGTPDYLYKALEMEFGFDLDPCPLNLDFDPTVDQDGLKLNWNGHRVFCNPPWNTVMPWVEKAFASKALTVFLLPARTDTAWFHMLNDSGAEIRLFRKRVHFLRDGIDGKKSPTDGTMLAVVRRMNAQGADLPVSKPFVWTEAMQVGGTVELGT